MPTTSWRASWRLGVLAVQLVIGIACIPEAKKPEEAHPDEPGRFQLKLAHIAGPRVKADDAPSKRRLEEAVGIASGVAGLDLVLFGGDVIANDAPATAPDSIEAFASLAGIIAAKRYVVFGERERAGALGRDDVLRVLARRKLAP